MSIAQYWIDVIGICISWCFRRLESMKWYTQRKTLDNWREDETYATLVEKQISKGKNVENKKVENDNDTNIER